MRCMLSGAVVTGTSPNRYLSLYTPRLAPDIQLAPTSITGSPSHSSHLTLARLLPGENTLLSNTGDILSFMLVS